MDIEDTPMMQDMHQIEKTKLNLDNLSDCCGNDLDNSKIFEYQSTYLTQSNTNNFEVKITSSFEKIAIVLQNLAIQGDQQSTQVNQKISCFESSTCPAVPISVYFIQVCAKINMPEEHALAVLVMINRVTESAFSTHERIYYKNRKNKSIDGFVVNSLTIHR